MRNICLICNVIIVFKQMRRKSLIRLPVGVDKKPATGLTDQSRRCGNQDKDFAKSGERDFAKHRAGAKRLHPRAYAPARPRAPGL